MFPGNQNALNIKGAFDKFEFLNLSHLSFKKYLDKKKSNL